MDEVMRCSVDHAAFYWLCQKKLFVFRSTAQTENRSAPRTLEFNHCTEANRSSRWHALWGNGNAAVHGLGWNIRFSCELRFTLLPVQFSLLRATLNQTLGYYRLLESPCNTKPTTVWSLWCHITTTSLVNDWKFYPLRAIHIPVGCWRAFHLLFQINATWKLTFQS